MPHSLPPLNALRIFAEASQQSTFRAAAQKLHLTTGSVSQQIRVLEDHLGYPLFVRLPRGIVLTQAGIELRQAVNSAFSEIQATLERLDRQAGQRPLALTVSAYFASYWLSRRLGDFWHLHPNVGLWLRQGSSTKDTTDDVEIRWGDGHWSDAQVELLFHCPLRPVCGPTLYEKHRHDFADPRDLGKHTILCEDPILWEQWLAQVDALGAVNVRKHGQQIDDATVRLQAALAGQGIMLGDCLLGDYYVGGQLLAPFTPNLSGYGYYIVHQSHVTPHPHTGDFVQWLREQASAFVAA